MAFYEIKRPIEANERALDLALLAYILNGAAPFYGRLKLQKTTFLVEHNLREHNLTGPRFRFYRYDHGPFSKDLLDAYELLQSRGLAPRYGIGLTKRGTVLAEFVEAMKEVPQNRKPFDEIDAVLRKCRDRNGTDLKEQLYEMIVRPEHESKGMKIRDISAGTDLVAPTSEASLEVPEDLLRLIQEELELDEKKLDKAREQVPQIIEDFIRTVTDARSRPA
jgi:uncharacterized protein YwgA